MTSKVLLERLNGMGEYVKSASSTVELPVVRRYREKFPDYPKERRALVWKMEAYLATKRPYIQLVVSNAISAQSPKWTGFEPTLGGSCKCYFTSPHPSP